MCSVIDFFTLIVGAIETNCYVVKKKTGNDVILIDPGGSPETIHSFLEQHSFKPIAIVHTHGHGDHIGADNSFDLPVYIHSEDAVMLFDPKRNLSEMVGEPFVLNRDCFEFPNQTVFSIDEFSFQLIHTPGHSPGGVCFLCEQFLFTGDTLFFRSIGRTDLPFADADQLVTSIMEGLFSLPEDLIVLPGHGPRTVLGDEKRSNPFVGFSL